MLSPSASYTESALVVASRVKISGIPSVSTSAIVSPHFPGASQMRSVGNSPCADCSSKNVTSGGLHNISMRPSLSVSAMAFGKNGSANEKIRLKLPFAAISKMCAKFVPISAVISSNLPFLFRSTGVATACSARSVDMPCKRCSG